MTRPPRKKHTAYVPPPPEPALSPAQLDAIADRVLANGDVYQASSINELCSLLVVLEARGYVLKHQTSKDIAAAPWLFIVVKEATIESVSTTEDDKSRLDKRHPATAQADPLRGGK